METRWDEEKEDNDGYAKEKMKKDLLEGEDEEGKKNCPVKTKEGNRIETNKRMEITAWEEEKKKEGKKNRAVKAKNHKKQGKETQGENGIRNK